MTRFAVLPVADDAEMPSAYSQHPRRSADWQVMSWHGSQWRGALAILATTWCVGTVAFFALHLVPGALGLMSGLSLMISALGAGAACWWRGRSTAERRTSVAWRFLGAAATAWGLGQVVTNVYELLLERDIPFPSLADVGYLLAVPLFSAGLLHLALPAGQLATRLRALLDGLLISTALLLVSWVSVLGPLAHTSADSVLDKIILIAYPVGDIATVTLVAYVGLRMRATGVHPGVPYHVIGLALASFAFADSGYAYLSLTDSYASGSVIDCGWLCGFTALFVAAVAPSDRPARETSPETRPLGMLLPYLILLVSVVVSLIITRVSGRPDSVGPGIRSSLIVLLIARQVLTLQENSRLTRHLERRVDERTSELKLSQERFRALVEHSSEVVSLVHPDGVIVYQSESSQPVFGHSSESLVGHDFKDLLDVTSQANLDSALRNASRTPLHVAVVELRLLHGDGGWRQIETTVTNLLDEVAVRAIVLNSRDVSESRQLEGQLVHQAFHDSLTALANRALFNDRVAHALERRGPDPVSVLFLDLDGFKEVNDSLGHGFGDHLLVQVADRLRGCVRASETVARLGGDEFAVLIEDDTSSSRAIALAERIGTIFVDPFLVNERELLVQASIGIASSDDDISDAGHLIRNADLAMYQAKARQDGAVAFYDPAMHSSLMERLELESELRKAIRAGELVVHYQPTYALDTSVLIGVEALLRWTHPDRGAIPPDVFIPLAEQTGLIHELGRFVLTEACHQAAEWGRINVGTPLKIGVNISGRQLQRADFVDEVRHVLETSGLAPTQLILELTESVLMDDTEANMGTLAELKDVGVHLAIDDFGTGYSSLSYLHRFPIDILKIDRSFVERLSGDDPQENLIHSIVQLGQTMQLATIAEGIEDSAQLSALQRLGCEMAQGYHFGRPGPPDIISALIAEPQRGSQPIPAQAGSPLQEENTPTGVQPA